MALKLTVGVNKKIGQPNYGSLGAQCQLEYDLDLTLLLQDREQFQQRVQQAYLACSQAVEEELARPRGGAAVRQPPPAAPPAGAPAAGPGPGPGPESAGASCPAKANGAAPGPEADGGCAGGSGGHGLNGGNGARPRAAGGRRAATPAQIQALARLAARRELELEPLLVKFFAVPTSEQLSVVEASQLIHWLQSQPLAEGLSS